MNILDRMHMAPCKKTRLPVKELIEQLDVDSKNKKMLEKHIASMHLVSLLNEETIRIRAYVDEEYSFETIYVFEIELKANNQLSDFTYLVHSAFQESTLLIMQYKGHTYLSGALKRKNKTDSTKTVIEDSIWTAYKNDIEIEDVSVKNIKEYYEYLVRWIYRLKILDVTGVYPINDGDYRNEIKQYDQLNTQINKLNEEYAAASMRNEKMRIDEELYKKEQELKQLKEEISGGQK